MSAALPVPATLSLEEIQRAFTAIHVALRNPTGQATQNSDLRGLRLTNAGASVGPSDYTTQTELTTQASTLTSALKSYVDTQITQRVASAIATVPGSPTGPTVPAPTQPPVGTTPPTGVPSAGTLTRGFDLSTATVYNAPMDIASWPVTGTITGATISGAPGENGVYLGCTTISPAYSAPPVSAGLWPQDPTAYPDAVNLQYTVWAIVEISGTWYTSGFIQMWVGRPGTGTGVIGSDWLNWAYDSRWGPMDTATPTFGSTMGFFLSAGNARGQSGVTTVRERSEVVMLSLPADINGGSYS